jgi:tetratricopeptide (TPR) repeat protein
LAKELTARSPKHAAHETSEKRPSDAQIIRRQIFIVGGILLSLGLVYLLWLWGEDTGWGNADRAVKLKLDKANQAFVNRDLDQAVAIYEKIVTKYPVHPLAGQALTQLATAYEEMGKLDQAASAYEKLLAQTGEEKADLRAYTMLQIGKLYRQQGNFAKALEQLEAVRKYRPGSDWAGEALSEIGRSWQDQKDYDKAVASYKQLIKEMPAGFLAAEAQSAIGECMEAKGMKREAIRAYQVVLDKYPSAVWDQAKARIDFLKKSFEKKRL